MVYVADIIEPVPQSVLDSDRNAAGLCESVGLEEHVHIAVVSVEVEKERVAHGTIGIEDLPKPGNDVGCPEADVLLFRVGGFFKKGANANATAKVSDAV